METFQLHSTNSTYLNDRGVTAGRVVTGISSCMLFCVLTMISVSGSTGDMAVKRRACYNFYFQIICELENQSVINEVQAAIQRTKGQSCRPL